MVGHTFEYNPTVLKMKKIIKHNNFGKIYYIYSTRVNLGQIRGDVNALWNLAPHDISILNFLLDATPIEVKATGASFLQKDIEDVVFALLKYHDNILAEIHVSWLDPIKERKMTIVGSKKMLIFDDLDNEMPLKIYDKRVDTGEVAKGQSSEYKLKLHSGDIHIPQIEIKEPLLEELRHFFNCIKINRQPLTGLTNGLNVVRVLEACQESIRGKNSWVKI
jgi:predicted dehydrogenase